MRRIEQGIETYFANSGSEKAVLAIVFQDPERVLDVDIFLREEDFFERENREILKSLRRLYLNSDVEAISIRMVIDDLNMAGIKPDVDYIKSLFESPVDSVNIYFYMRKIKEGSRKYRLYLTHEQGKQEILENSRDGEGFKTSDELIAQSEDKILRVSMDSIKSEEPVDLGEGIKKLLEERTKQPVKVLGIPTGFKILDEKIDGLRPKTLTVIGGRPKSGKSTFLMSVSVKTAYEQQTCSVLYIDSEMSLEEQRDRALTMLSKVPQREIGHGTFIKNPQWKGRIDKAIEIMEGEGYKIFFKYLPAFSQEEIGALARKYVRKENIGLLVLDYIKIPYGMTGKDMQEWQRLGYLTTYLKDLAGELSIPILSASQLNREADQKSQIAQSHFGGSDRILHYADVGLALAQKTKKEFDETGGLQAGTHWLHVVAARSGGTCRNIGIKFIKKNLQMEEAVTQRVETDEEDSLTDFEFKETINSIDSVSSDLSGDLDDNPF